MPGSRLRTHCGHSQSWQASLSADSEKPASFPSAPPQLNGSAHSNTFSHKRGAKGLLNTVNDDTDVVSQPAIPAMIDGTSTVQRRNQPRQLFGLRAPQAVLYAA